MPAAIPREILIPAGLLAFIAAMVGYLAGSSPAFALGAALALAFMLVVLANLYAGLIGFIVLTFAADIPGLFGSAVTVSKLAGLLLLLSWLAHLAIRKDVKADLFSAHPGAAWILFFFVGWLVLSLLWAEDRAVSIESLFRLSLNVVFFLIVFTAIRTRLQAVGAALAFVAGACIDALYGLFNPVNVANTARITGSISKPGELAAALVAGLVLSLGLAAVFKGKPLMRLAVLATAPLCALGIFLTGSRGGLIALTVALVAFIVIGAKWRGRTLVLTLAVAVAGISFYTYAASPDLRDRVTSIGSGSGRIDLWTVGWRMVEQDPVEGVGIGNFPVASPHYVLVPGAVARAQYVSYSDKVAHNTYLELWAETGFVGLGLFLLLVGFCVRSAFRAAREFARQGDHSMELLSHALFAAQAGFLAGAFFTSREYAKDVWLILALGPAFLAVASGQRQRSVAEDEIHPTPATAGSRPALGQAR